MNRIDSVRSSESDVGGSLVEEIDDVTEHVDISITSDQRVEMGIAPQQFAAVQLVSVRFRKPVERQLAASRTHKLVLGPGQKQDRHLQLRDIRHVLRVTRSVG